MNTFILLILWMAAISNETEAGNSKDKVGRTSGSRAERKHDDGYEDCVEGFERQFGVDACYKIFVSEPVNFDDAYSKCLALGAGYRMETNDVDLIFLRKLFGGGGDYPWIGLTMSMKQKFQTLQYEKKKTKKRTSCIQLITDGPLSNDKMSLLHGVDCHSTSTRYICQYVVNATTGSGTATSSTATPPTGTSPTATPPTGTSPTATPPTGTSPTATPPTGTTGTATSTNAPPPTGTTGTATPPTGTTGTATSSTATPPTGTTGTATSPTTATPPTGTTGTATSPTATPPTGTTGTATSPTATYYTWRSFKNNCYKYVHGSKVEMADAEKRCVEEGAHLVSFEDKEEAKFVFELAKEKNSTTVAKTDEDQPWTGVIMTTKSRVWTDKTKGGHIKWTLGEPPKTISGEICGKLAVDVTKTTKKSKLGLLIPTRCEVQSSTYICKKRCDTQ